MMEENDDEIRGSLAFHPLFEEVLNDILESLCEDCRLKIEKRFREYLGDKVYMKESLEKIALERDISVRDHPDLKAFVRIFNDVTWEENRHIGCYVSLEEILRLLD